MFYDSNYDKHFIPEEKGWYVQYKTESGDEGAEKLPREPLNVDDALLMLQEIDEDEIWYVQFYQEVKQQDLKKVIFLKRKWLFYFEMSKLIHTFVKIIKYGR